MICVFHNQISNTSLIMQMPTCLNKICDVTHPPPSFIVLQDWTCSKSSMMSQTFFKHDWGLVCSIVQHTPCIYSCWINQNTHTALFNSPNDYCLVDRWMIRKGTNICWTLRNQKMFVAKLTPPHQMILFYKHSHLILLTIKSVE